MSGNHSDRAILGQLAVTRRTLLVACVNLVFAFCGGRVGGGARALAYFRTLDSASAQYTRTNCIRRGRVSANPPPPPPPCPTASPRYE